MNKRWDIIKTLVTSLENSTIKDQISTDIKNIIITESLKLVSTNKLKFLIMEEGSPPPENFLSEFFYVSITEGGFDVISEGKVKAARLAGKAVGKAAIGAIGKGRTWINSRHIARRINMSGLGVKVFKNSESAKKEILRAVKDPKWAVEKWGMHAGSQVVATVVLPGTPVTNIKMFRKIDDLYKFLETEAGKKAKDIQIRQGKDAAMKTFEALKNHPGKVATETLDKVKQKLGIVTKAVKERPGKAVVHVATQAVTPNELLRYPVYMSVETVDAYIKKYGAKKAASMLARDASKISAAGASAVQRGIVNGVKKAPRESIPQELFKISGMSDADVARFFNAGAARRVAKEPTSMSQGFINKMFRKTQQRAGVKLVSVPTPS